jgi:hypothetical protein
MALIELILKPSEEMIVPFKEIVDKAIMVHQMAEHTIKIASNLVGDTGKIYDDLKGNITSLETGIAEQRERIHSLANQIASRPGMVELEVVIRQIIKEELKAAGLLGNNVVP